MKGKTDWPRKRASWHRMTSMLSATLMTMYQFHSLPPQTG